MGIMTRIKQRFFRPSFEQTVAGIEAMVTHVGYSVEREYLACPDPDSNYGYGIRMKLSRPNLRCELTLYASPDEHNRNIMRMTYEDHGLMLTLPPVFKQNGIPIALQKEHGAQ
jgi:hypothetical protein